MLVLFASRHFLIGIEIYSPISTEKFLLSNAIFCNFFSFSHEIYSTVKLCNLGRRLAADEVY